MLALDTNVLVMTGDDARQAGLAECLVAEQHQLSMVDHALGRIEATQRL
jgi:hypothetical protein